ncbi:MAG: Stp1/IreP family PP2C-type Ser/Thr phosphatase [Lachnospiraceae bacterium]|nr:Stp1/IreP family PP2C-type Ser/Thr phosphatase [Lachnospiraceae bacterium]
MRYFALTDTGRSRTENQDYVYASGGGVGILPNIFIVADGMGGHNAGDYASRRAVNIALKEIENSNESKPVAILNQAIKKANRILFEEASKDPAKRGMGTTFVAATISDKKLYVANVGDSRLYIANDSTICQITRDHSLVQEMMRNGDLGKFDPKRHPKRNAITRAIGAEEDVHIDFFEVANNNFEQFLLCSDGLTNMVDDNELFAQLKGNADAKTKANVLVSLANRKGGLDNISAIVVEPFEE